MSTPAISPFMWADYFETGFEDVDGQHHKLVDFINALAGRAISGVPIRPDELSHSLDGLARYAVHHFATEEALMERAGLDPRHIGAHRKAHADFVSQVEAMRGTADPMGALPGLYNFVTSWLSFHILDTDQSMARQLRAVAAGASPAQAFVAEQAQSRDPGSTALIAAVRSLLGLVAERNKELQNINASLEARVAERTAALTAANRDLLAAQRRLHEADRLAVVGQLAAGVAHEIGNPITGIACLAQNLREERGEDSELNEMSTQILEQTKRVSRIVQSLMNFAHAGGHQHAAQAVCLADVTQDAISLLALNRNSVDVQFFNLCDPLHLVTGDAQRLAQVLINLLSNARDASQPGGAIRVKTEANEDTVELLVEDEGSGIPKAIMDRLLEPFFTTKNYGTGLGLTNVKRLVEDNGGTLAVTSNQGAGTTFTLRFHPASS